MELVHFPSDFYFFPYILLPLCVILLILDHLNQDKVLTQDQLAEMSSYILAESAHNKWLQASDNKGGDLYVATMNDYIRVFLQVVAYYQFVNGGIGGDGPNKEELKLRGAQRRAQRIGNPTVLQKVLLDMLGGEEFCTRNPHLEGAEVFGSQKRRLDTPIGDDGETHRPDNVKLSRPRPGKRVTQSQPVTLPTIIEESSPCVQKVQVPSPAGLGFHRVTAVQETKVDVFLWHIARILYTSGKSCWAIHAGTKKKCTLRIVTNYKSVSASTYTGMWHHYKLQSMKRGLCLLPRRHRALHKGNSSEMDHAVLS